MISTHPSFIPPSDPKIPVWRYMDLAKYVSLLQTRALHFARADRLGDPFEGSVPYLNSEEGAKRIVDALAAAKAPELDKKFPGMSRDQIANMLSQMAAFHRASIAETYCNCWHMSEHESAAMWKLYCQASDAICIQSTFSSLADALPPWTNAGVVRYLDYDREAIDVSNGFNRFLTKRRSFEHEREVRAIAWSRTGGADGEQIRKCISGDTVVVPVDVSKLVRGVYVSPTSSPWFADVIAGLNKQYGLHAPVHRSRLEERPLY